MGQRPKRVKSSDNPYTLNYSEEENKYEVFFKDGTGTSILIEVPIEIYETLNQFELDDVSEINKNKRHIERSEIYEETLNERIMDKPLSIYELVERKIKCEELHKAIKQLPLEQIKRIEMYFFYDMTVEEIAAKENLSHQAISKSIRNAVAAIRKILKN